MIVINYMQTRNTSNIKLMLPILSDSKKLNFSLFHSERRKRKNQRHPGIAIVLRNVVKIKTQIMSLQSSVHFMLWHLLGQIWGNISHGYLSEASICALVCFLEFWFSAMFVLQAGRCAQDFNWEKQISRRLIVWCYSFFRKIVSFLWGKHFLFHVLNSLIDIPFPLFL
jgi:hypothetical protein